MSAQPIADIVARLCSPLPRTEAHLASWEDVKAIYKPYSHIWELDAQWLMGRSILRDIVDHWRTNLPTPSASGSSVSIEAQYPTVWDEITGRRVAITNFIPEELIAVFNDRVGEIEKLRWQSWVPELEELTASCAIINAFTMNRIKSIVYAAEGRAKVEGMPEFWQLGAAAFGLLPEFTP